MLKMAVLTHDDEIMCQSYRSNPYVIDRYRGSLANQARDDLRKLLGNL